MSDNEIKKGVALDIPDLAAVQDGAVVSRTVLDRETGSVTLFAFDEGQGLSEHTAPYDALVYVLEGALDIRIAGETARVKESQAIIMPANEPHALTAETRCRMLLVMIRS
ncbi:MAG: cupin domain-containing protein [Thermoplasmatota archaeon]